MQTFLLQTITVCAAGAVLEGVN